MWCTKEMKKEPLLLICCMFLCFKTMYEYIYKSSVTIMHKNKVDRSNKSKVFLLASFGFFSIFSSSIFFINLPQFILFNYLSYPFYQRPA